MDLRSKSVPRFLQDWKTGLFQMYLGAPVSPLRLKTYSFIDKQPLISPNSATTAEYARGERIKYNFSWMHFSFFTLVSVTSLMRHVSKLSNMILKSCSKCCQIFKAGLVILRRYSFVIYSLSILRKICPNTGVFIFFCSRTEYDIYKVNHNSQCQNMKIGTRIYSAKDHFNGVLLLLEYFFKKSSLITQNFFRNRHSQC